VSDNDDTMSYSVLLISVHRFKSCYRGRLKQIWQISDPLFRCYYNEIKTNIISLALLVHMYFGNYIFMKLNNYIFTQIW